MMEWLILGAVAAAIAKGFKDSKEQEELAKTQWKEQEELAKTQWFGHMGCNACGYQWTSRKMTPPARCPNCRGNNIGTILGR